MLGFSLFSRSYPKTKVYERTDWHKSTKNEPGTFETGGQSNRSIFHFPEILRYIMCMCVCDGLKSRLTLVAKVFFTHLHFGILQSLTRSDCELPAARLRI